MGGGGEGRGGGGGGGGGSTVNRPSIKKNGAKHNSKMPIKAAKCWQTSVEADTGRQSKRLMNTSARVTCEICV